LAIQGAVIWWLWHGSPFAWLIALTFALFTLVSFPLIQPKVEASLILAAFFCIAQVGILVARPIPAFVWSRRETPAPSS
jgi:hypothetical protein